MPERVEQQEDYARLRPTRLAETGSLVALSASTAGTTASAEEPWVGGQTRTSRLWREIRTHRNRLTPELLYDILVATHLAAKAGENPSLSNIGHRANVSNGRLKERLDQLMALGLVDAKMALTNEGYEYCSDYKNHVEPFLRRYGLTGKAERIRVSQ